MDIDTPRKRVKQMEKQNFALTYIRKKRQKMMIMMMNNGMLPLYPYANIEHTMKGCNVKSSGVFVFKILQKVRNILSFP